MASIHQPGKPILTAEQDGPMLIKTWPASIDPSMGLSLTEQLCTELTGPLTRIWPVSIELADVLPVQRY